MSTVLHYLYCFIWFVLLFYFQLLYRNLCTSFSWQKHVLYYFLVLFWECIPLTLFFPYDKFANADLPNVHFVRNITPTLGSSCSSWVISKLGILWAPCHLRKAIVYLFLSIFLELWPKHFLVLLVHWKVFAFAEQNSLLSLDAKIYTAPNMIFLNFQTRIFPKHDIYITHLILYLLSPYSSPCLSSYISFSTIYLWCFPDLHSWSMFFVYFRLVSILHITVTVLA